MALGDLIYNRINTEDDEVFKDRDLNFFNNALKDIKDFGGGLASLASFVPQVVRGEANLDAGEFGQAVWRGLLEQYGQQNGFDLGNLGKSFYYHPLNLLDVMPVAKAAGITGKVGRGLSKTFPATTQALKTAKGALKAADYIEDPVQIAKKAEAVNRWNRIYGKRPIPNVVEDTGKIVSATSDDGLSAIQGLKEAGEVSYMPIRKGGKFSTGKMSTWGYAHDMIKKLPAEQQDEIMNAAKNSMGVTSSKEIADALLPDYLENVRSGYNNLVKGGISKTVNASDDVAVKAGEVIADDAGQLSMFKYNKLSPERLQKHFNDVDVVAKDPAPIQYTGLEKALRPLDTAFKRAVLASPAWIIGNRAGNWTFNAMEGVTPEDYIQAMTDLKDAMPKQALGGFFNTSEGAVEGAVKIPIAKQWTDFWFNTEAKLESMDRGANYTRQLKRLAQQELASKGIRASKSMIYAKAKEISGNPTIKKQALEAVDASMGGYGLGTPFQKRLSLYVPFWRWYRALGQVTAHQAMNHPIKFQGLRRASATGAMVSDEQVQELEAAGYPVPEYARYGAFEGYNEEGNPVISSSQKLVPYKTFTDLANSFTNFPSQESLGVLNPLLQMVARQSTGTNWTGKPATAPDVVQDFLGGKRYHVDPNTGELTELNQSQLPDQYKLPYLLSDLLRSYTPLGTVERWMPYRSYDSMMFVPNTSNGSEFRPIDIDYFAKQAGVRTKYPIYKKRELKYKDKKRIRKRHKKVYGGD